jgi:hypothetical protein
MNEHFAEVNKRFDCLDMSLDNIVGQLEMILRELDERK